MATIKITYEKIINANAAVQNLTRLRLPISKIKVTKRIREMAEALQKEFEFVISEEKKIIEAYPEVEFNDSGNPILKPDTEVDGTPTVSDDKKAKGEEFMKEISALHETETEWEFDVIKISEKDLKTAGDFSLTAEDLDVLDGFIEFVEED